MVLHTHLDDRALVVSDVCVSSRGQKILDRISLASEPGSVHVLLGHNGSGKSTLLKAVATAVTPSSGTIHVFGRDAIPNRKWVRKRSAFVRQDVQLDLEATGLENARLHATLLGVAQKDVERYCLEKLSGVGLGKDAHKKVSSYSGGMKRKLDLLLAMLGDPDILLLDEPTVGLDPQSKKQVWGIVRDIAGSGRTILMSTQMLDEAHHLADRISILRDGQCIVTGDLPAIRRTVGSQRIEVAIERPEYIDSASEVCKSLGFLDILVGAGTTLSARSESRSDVARLTEALTSFGILCTSVRLRNPSMSEIYYKYGYGAL